MPRSPARGTKTGTFDPQSEAIREKHGEAYDNYASVKHTAEEAAKVNKAAR